MTCVCNRIRAFELRNSCELRTWQRSHGDDAAHNLRNLDQGGGLASRAIFWDFQLHDSRHSVCQKCEEALHGPARVGAGWSLDLAMPKVPGLDPPPVICPTRTVLAGRPRRSGTNSVRIRREGWGRAGQGRCEFDANSRKSENEVWRQNSSPPALHLQPSRVDLVGLPQCSETLPAPPNHAQPKTPAIALQVEQVIWP